MVGNKNPKIPLLMDSVLNTPHMILQSKLDEIVNVLQLKDNDVDILKIVAASKDKTSDDELPLYVVKDGIAEIAIKGTLAKRMGFIAAMSGGTSYEKIRQQINVAENDNAVKGIFLEHDTPGGMVDGAFTASDFIFSMRNKKPVLAFANGLMTSAGYLLGSASKYIIASDRATLVGSIGVVTVHLDKSERFKAQGIKPTIFSSGKYKKTGNEYEPLSKDDKKEIQSRPDYIYTLFVDTIAKNRNVSVETVINEMAEGRIFIGQQAIDAGLIDEIADKDHAISILKDVINGKTSFEERKKQLILQNNKKGGVKTMADNETKELMDKIDDLEKRLDVSEKRVVELEGSKVTGDLEAKITELTSRIETMKVESEGAQNEINDLKKTVTDNTVFVDAGKKVIEDTKADIQKISVQIDGTDYDEVLVNKQLEAFGTDIASLNQFKTNLENRRSKMIKAGNINPDENLTEGQKKGKTEADEIALGESLVPKHLRIVKS